MPSTSDPPASYSALRTDELLQRYPALAQHADISCRQLIGTAQQVEIPAGTTLFRETESCRNFMWVLEGSVRVFKHSDDGREVTLYRVGEGELCILTLNCLLSERPYPANASADTNLTGLSINVNDFHRALNLSLGFRNYVLDTLSARMSDIVDLVSDIAFRRLDLRLACMLGQRFERSAGAPIRITHEELAHELGTTREVVSRILKEFERQECVSLSRGCIFLGDAEGLRWFGRKREPHSA